MSARTSTTAAARGVRTAVVTGVALPALLAAAPLAAADTAGAGGTGAVPGCESHHVKLIENGRSAAAGTTAFHFALDRVSDGDGACLMPGSVEVRWVDGDGEQIGSWARQRSEPGEAFVIDEADVAEFTMFHANTGNYPPDDCEPTEAAGIEYAVGPNGELAYAGLGPGLSVCADPGIRGTSLSPVTPSPYN
ncbi:DUF4232 domain-containing protein [Streptomonospora wellingtoniae]|uniref:DUF4232 domain-containing protein n=1 Tax=Streptomonospora wellingtoniae TaxID=3075544 RepID=A0ABU2KNE8_9ACTN|nr:DUF4232 domain-containing protein [Streptomonospora sp. DSM 45055]MDT0300768.1 DUF4232 domain-containing protein [Streptomonospora sp. DSM 45055]